MRHIAQIIDAATADGSIQYRRAPYGPSGVREFLRDVIAMANASIDGPRHIVIGVEVDAGGGKIVHPVSDADFGGSPDYVRLANHHIEPPIDISYQPSLVGGKQIGVFEIGNCRDRPYMMRVGYSETLQLGDAYMRVDDTAVRMGRAQLQALFTETFHDSLSADNVEVGFAGDKILHSLRLTCRDLAELPSAVATRRLEEMMSAQAARHKPGSTSMVARLAHARLYGSDEPYVSRSPEELVLELDQVGFKYAEQDREFLFGASAQTIQMQICNHGSEPVTDATFVLVLPRDDEFLVAHRVPSTSRASNDDAPYPTVTLQNNAIRITQTIGTIPTNGTINVFAEPLRIFAGHALKGRKFGIHYALEGQKLRSAIKGRLRLLFKA